MISIYCAHSLFSLCCRVLKHSGTALKEETGDREGIWQHVGLSPQSQIPVCFVLWEAFNPTLQKRNALDSVGARAHPAGLGFRSAIESIVIFNSYNGWRGRGLCWWDYFVGGGQAARAQRRQIRCSQWCLLYFRGMTSLIFSKRVMN